MKKIFTFSLVSLLLVLIFLGAYNLVFKDKKVLQEDSITEEDIAVENKTAEKKENIFAVTEEAVISSAINKENETILYSLEKNGYIYESSLSGEVSRPFFKEATEGLVDVFWSLDASRTINVVNENNINVFYFYDYEKKEGSKIKDNIDNVVWDNIGSKIIYKYFDAETKERTLNIANADGSDWKKIVDIDFRNISLAPIPQSSFISFWNYPETSSETSFNMVSIVGGDVENLLIGLFNADYLWSPNGKNVLVSSLGEKEKNSLELGIFNRENKSYKSLGISTLVSKCAWSQDIINVYCAIPSDTLAERDYYNKDFLTKDAFWKINTENGKKERIFELGEINTDYDATKLVLSPKEDYLFFINDFDGRLYGMPL